MPLQSQSHDHSSLQTSGALEASAPFLQEQREDPGKHTLGALVNVRQLIDQAEEAYRRDPHVYSSIQLDRFSDLSKRFRGGAPFGNLSASGDLAIDNFAYGVLNTMAFNIPEVIAQWAGSSLAGNTAAERRMFGIGELVGIAPALWTGGGVFKGAQTLASRALSGRITSGIAAGVATGAPVGALYGATADEEVGLRGDTALESSIAYGILGGVTGPFAGPLASKVKMPKGMPKWGNFFSGKFKGSNMERISQGKIGKAEVEQMITKAERGGFNYYPKGKNQNQASKMIEDFEGVYKKGGDPTDDMVRLRDALQKNLDEGRALNVQEFSDRLKGTTAVGTVASRFGDDAAVAFADDIGANAWKVPSRKLPKNLEGKGKKTSYQKISRPAYQSELEAMLNTMPDDEVLAFKRGIDLRKRFSAADGAQKIKIGNEIKALEGATTKIDDVAGFVKSKSEQFYKARVGIDKGAPGWTEGMKMTQAEFAEHQEEAGQFIWKVVELATKGKSGAASENITKLIAGNQKLRADFVRFVANSTDETKAAVIRLLVGGRWKEAMKIIRASTTGKVSGAARAAPAAKAATEGADESAANITELLKNLPDAGETANFPLT